MSSSPLPSPSRFFSKPTNSLKPRSSGYLISEESVSRLARTSLVARQSLAGSSTSIAHANGVLSANGEKGDGGTVARALGTAIAKPTQKGNGESAAPNGTLVSSCEGEHQLPKKNEKHKKANTNDMKESHASKTRKPAVAKRGRKPTLEIVSAGLSEDPRECDTETVSKKAAEASTQTKLKKGRVTKAPGASVNANKSKQSSSVCNDGNKSPREVCASPCTSVGEEFGCLDEAIKRRRNWTPTKDTEECLVALPNVEPLPVNESQPTMAAAGKSKTDCFGNLLDDYGYAIDSKRSTTPKNLLRKGNGEALTKRRKVELVTASFRPPPEVATSKSKSPKKKPQTVTGKATAPFVAIEDIPANNLLQYLAPQAKSEATGEKGDATATHGSNFKRKKRAPSGGKAACEKSSKTISALLLPENTLEKAQQQDFLFGTSSQLARDESPSFLQDLEQAIKESKSVNSPSEQDGDGLISLSSASDSMNGSKLQIFTAPKNLWSVAARGVNGALQEAEVIDLSITPKVQASRNEAFAEHHSNAAKACEKLPSAEKPSPPKSHDWHVVTSSPKATGSEYDNATLNAIQAGPGTQAPISKSLAEASLRNRPQSRSPTRKAKGPIPKEQIAQVKESGMPNFQGYPAADLSKEIKIKGFKPVKRRADQIALLERCWQSSKDRAALLPLSLDANNLQPPAVVASDFETSKTAASVKKRGRPPKAKSTNLTEKGDTPDGKESHHFKTKSRSKKVKGAAQLPKQVGEPIVPTKRNTTPPAEVFQDIDATPRPAVSYRHPASPTAVEQSPTSSADATLTPIDHAFLMQRITDAVMTYPPTHDMKSLTWYEKMLMYDPIVLEDLTVWLNTEGLARIGVDDEIEPNVVKEWCESQSICCLWRENLRGGTRARY